MTAKEMTVQDLIDALVALPDKTLPVVVRDSEWDLVIVDRVIIQQKAIWNEFYTLKLPAVEIG